MFEPFMMLFFPLLFWACLSSCFEESFLSSVLLHGSEGVPEVVFRDLSAEDDAGDV